jgi:hypothetical protein
VEKFQLICYVLEKRLVKEHTFEQVFDSKHWQNMELIIFEVRHRFKSREAVWYVWLHILQNFEANLSNKCKTVHVNAICSPLHTMRKLDGKIISVIKTLLGTIPQKFQLQYFEHIPVYITSGDAKGFLCTILNVKCVSSETALKWSLNSGIMFTVDHPSAVVGKLVKNIPYEQVIQAAFVLPFHLLVYFTYMSLEQLSLSTLA